MGFMDLNKICGLCYWCNRRENCKVYKSWGNSFIWDSDRINVSLNVTRCLDFKPDDMIDLSSKESQIELKQRTTLRIT